MQSLEGNRRGNLCSERVRNMGEKDKERIDKSNEQQNDERREAEVIKGKEQRERLGQKDIY